MWTGALGRSSLAAKAIVEHALSYPVDGGRALVEYLQAAHPTSDCRRVFLSMRAPHRALTSTGVSEIFIGGACRAGRWALTGSGTGPQPMFRAGASLLEISTPCSTASCYPSASTPSWTARRFEDWRVPWPTGGEA